MLQYLNSKHGQSTMEYAVLICVIIGALLTVQVYIKRGVQGRMKSSADDIGDQFSPGNVNEVRQTNRTSSSWDAQNTAGSFSGLTNETTNSLSNSVILNADYEYWGNAT